MPSASASAPSERCERDTERSRLDSSVASPHAQQLSSSSAPPPLAPFNPTGEGAFRHIMTDVLKLSGGDVLWDLGCGDGRCLIAAAQAVEGLRCVGVESDPALVERARTALRGMSDDSVRSRVEIHQGDAVAFLRGPPEKNGRRDENGSSGLTSDASAGDGGASLPSLLDATAIYLFLLPKGLELLKPLLERLVRERQRDEQRSHHHGELRVCTYMFQIRGWTPSRVDRTTKSGSAIYLYNCGEMEEPPTSTATTTTTSTP